MKKITFILPLILIISSSVAFATNFKASAFTEPDSTCNPEIYRKKNLFGLNANYLGSDIIGDELTYLSVKRCSEAAAMEKLKSQACYLNANLINITIEIKPGETIIANDKSPCYRCIADFYSIDLNELTVKILNRENRKIISYDDNKPITWKDFDIELPESSIVPYEFLSNIELLTGKMSFWTGAFKEYKAQGVFYCDLSKVKKSIITEQFEKQFELLFSLTQLYAKRLEFDLNSRNPKISNSRKIQKIIYGYLTLLAIEKDSFNRETEYGNNKIALKNWEDKIVTELKQFE